MRGRSFQSCNGNICLSLFVIIYFFDFTVNVYSLYHSSDSSFTSSWILIFQNKRGKSVYILSYSGPHFPAFGLNTEKYSLSLLIQAECGKIRTRITPNTGAFYAVWARHKNLYSWHTSRAFLFWKKLFWKIFLYHLGLS